MRKKHFNTSYDKEHLKDLKNIYFQAMSLYRHNVGWSGGNFRGEDKKAGGGGDMYDMGDFSDGEEGEGGASSNLGDISLAPTKITRVATYPMTDTNTGRQYTIHTFFWIWCTFW